jgi:nickel/cobalt transporter (NiCoT) family protein
MTWGLSHLSSLFGNDAQNLRVKAISFCVLLLATNAAAWIWALVAFGERPILLGTALLAYGLGLRHAFDADHIAAIDNVVRKLMRTGKYPIGIGLFFSLGHSTVVVGLCLAIAFATAVVQDGFDSVKAVGEAIGITVSASFLFAIAFANLVVLKEVYGAFRKVKAGGTFAEQDVDMLLAGRGFLARVCRGLFRLVGRSWHMYPLGILFGLGFDTATEVGLLGISAAGAAKGLSIWSVLIFPALFTAGMTLADTADGILMLGTYHWAFVKPIRKLYYNMIITLVSVMVAVLIGGIEALGLLGHTLRLEGAFWKYIGSLNQNLGSMGYLILGVFLASWVVSAVIYRLKGYDHVDVPPLGP